MLARTVRLPTLLAMLTVAAAVIGCGGAGSSRSAEQMQTATPVPGQAMEVAEADVAFVVPAGWALTNRRVSGYYNGQQNVTFSVLDTAHPWTVGPEQQRPEPFFLSVAQLTGKPLLSFEEQSQESLLATERQKAQGTDWTVEMAERREIGDAVAIVTRATRSSYPGIIDHEAYLKFPDGVIVMLFSQAYEAVASRDVQEDFFSAVVNSVRRIGAADTPGPVG